MNEERPEERFVRERFKGLYAVDLEKVPTSNTKTFDYWLVADGKREAAVEVKRFEPKPLPDSAYDSAEELSRMATLDPKDIPRPDRNPNDEVPTYHEMLLREAGVMPPRKATGP